MANTRPSDDVPSRPASFVRRSGRLTTGQQAAWDRRHAQWWRSAEAVAQPGFDLGSWFGRSAPLAVEIGSGIGETVVALAAARPAYNVLGFEVWRPGVARTFAQLEAAGAQNVRMLSVDAVWAFEHVIGPGSVHELWTFFPDPWPKRRHRQRRLVDPSFAALAASRLVPGGCWRLATDWEDYADQMRAVLDGEPLLAGGVTDRWGERPRTRFEMRAEVAGRIVTDLRYRRRP